MAAARSKTENTEHDDPGSETLHADYYRQLRDKVSSWAENMNPTYREYLLLVPDLFHFLCRLMLDTRVSGKDKTMLGLALAYVISPIDLIPDFIPGLGLVDDLIVMVIALDSVLKRVPAAVVKEHWAGDADLYAVIKESLAKADHWLGKGLFARLKKMAQDQGFWPDTAVDEVVSTAKEAASRAAAVAGSAAEAARSAMTGEPRRARTPSRRPSQSEPSAEAAAPKKKTAKKAVTKKKATKKTTKKTISKAPSTKKKASKKAATKTVAKAAPKKAAKKSKPAARTIAGKSPKKTKES